MSFGALVSMRKDIYFLCLIGSLSLFVFSNTDAYSDTGKEKELPHKTVYVLPDCENFSQEECLYSRYCNLTREFKCRLPENNCERNFQQAYPSPERHLDVLRANCEMTVNCKLEVEKCWCPPQVRCVCGGGAPPQCVPEKKND